MGRGGAILNGTWWFTEMTYFWCGGKCWSVACRTKLSHCPHTDRTVSAATKQQTTDRTIKCTVRLSCLSFCVMVKRQRHFYSFIVRTQL